MRVNHCGALVSEQHSAENIAEPEAITMTPADPSTELTCQQAADRLGVSLEFLTQLLDDGSLRCRQIEGERRISVCDLIEFQRQLDERRHVALDELSAQAQELDMGY